MGSHSYLQNLQTNINSLQTAGLLNSHANRFTTTNVGHLVGGNTSVITLSELNFAISFTDAQIAAEEAKADAIRDASEARINADPNLTDIQKKLADDAADAADAKIHAWLEAHRAAQAAPELSELCFLTHAIGSALAKLCNHANPAAVEKVQNSGYGYI